MTQGTQPAIGVRAVGPAACAALAFRVAGQLRVATVVKATFVLVPDRPMLLVDPDPLLTADRRSARAPESSLLAASDLVPWRPRADVTLRGHAKAPLGQPTSVMGVRFMIARGEKPLLDKRLVVQGSPGPGGPAAGPAPFTSIPLVYDLAAGGPASPENPVGVAENSGRWPNILDAARQPRPVGFGPLSAAWPVRGRLWHALASPPGSAIPELPADFQWDYFHAAPPDQRIDYLQGDEWVGFEGMSSQLPRLVSSLPRARALAKVYGPEPKMRAGRVIPLVADALSVDADQLRCWVVWRGALVLNSEAELAAMMLVAGVETPERPLSFPAEYEAPGARGPGPAAAPPTTSRRRSKAVEALSVTLDTESTPRGPATPFEAAPPAQSTPASPRKKADKRMMMMQAIDPGVIASAQALAHQSARPPEETLDPTSQAGAPPTPFAAAPGGADAPTSTQPVPPMKAGRPERPWKKAAATMAVDVSTFEAGRASVLPFAGHPLPSPAEHHDRPSHLPAATPFDRPSALPPEPHRASAPPPEPLAPMPPEPPFRPSAPPPAPLAPMPPEAPFRPSALPPEVPIRPSAPAIDVSPRDSRPSVPPPLLGTVTPEVPGDGPKTLGAHFLAAMARAASRGGRRSPSAEAAAVLPSYLRQPPS